MTPKGFLRQLLSVGTRLLHFVIGHVGILGYRVLDDIGNLGIVIVSTMNHLDAVLNLAGRTFLGICPKAEARQVGRDARHLKGNGL